jgi:hypothetical protein
LSVSLPLAIAWLVTTNTSFSLTPTHPWSGIDAGRREQVNLTATSLRSFRRSRHIVKGTSAQILNSVELRGDAAHLRALRSAEMQAWEQSGGDFYRPARAVA